jgi:hypothetical protein
MNTDIPIDLYERVEEVLKRNGRRVDIHAAP